jgi:hypothetical protein
MVNRWYLVNDQSRQLAQKAETALLNTFFAIDRTADRLNYQSNSRTSLSDVVAFRVQGVRHGPPPR